MFGLGWHEIIILAFCGLVPTTVAVIVLVVVLVSRKKGPPVDRD